MMNLRTLTKMQKTINPKVSYPRSRSGTQPHVYHTRLVKGDTLKHHRPFKRTK